MIEDLLDTQCRVLSVSIFSFYAEGGKRESFPQNNIQRFGFFLVATALRLSRKDQTVRSLHSKDRTKLGNTLCGQNSEFLNVTAGAGL
jgi:hypothetical protein